MTEISEEITKEVDDMISALEKAKSTLEKKFKSLHEEFLSEAFQNFHFEIESSQRYCFDRWIRETCDNIIEGLLSGETEWLKHQNIISEYNWERINAVRIAILKANGGEIENSVIACQQKEIEELKKSLKYWRDSRND